jgi:hypothetical protein
MPQEGNRLVKTLTNEEFSELKTIIKSVNTKLVPFTVIVDETEVVSLSKVGDGDKVLIADCISEGKDAEEFLPVSFKMVSIQTSDTLHDQFYELEDALFEIYQHVRRNRMLAGSEASGAVSTFYGIIKALGTGKNKFAAAAAMFKRIQGYYLKRIEAAKVKKRKAETEKLAEAEKLAAEAERAAEKNVPAAA